MVDVATRVAIWGRAGGRCSDSRCRRILIYRPDEAADPSLIGEVCHIKAKSLGGPRYDENYPEEFRESYDNLLLMCRIHHKIIDDHPEIYSVEKLRALKVDHETWVDSQLSGQEKDARSAREKYSVLLAAIEKQLDFGRADRWLGFMGSNEYPRFEKKFAGVLFDFPTWIVRQFWPNSIPEIESSVMNLAQALDDYTHFFVKYSSPEAFPEFYTITKFYQSSEWNEERYERQSKKWEGVIAEAGERALEIAKALNLLVKIVRAKVVMDYRTEEGWFVVPGHFADSNLSAMAVPRYNLARETEILSDPRYLSVFNVAQ
jgi:hypothetical protein